jgi:hypothetical protein
VGQFEGGIEKVGISVLCMDNWGLVFVQFTLVGYKMCKIIDGIA